MFRISEVVGVSRPAKPATLFRAISIRFIQAGRRAKIAKKISMTPASVRRNGVRYASRKSARSIRALPRALSEGTSHSTILMLVSEQYDVAPRGRLQAEYYPHIDRCVVVYGMQSFAQTPACGDWLR